VVAYKNINSEELFILIRDLGNGKKLLVTPNAEIKALENRFFKNPVEEDEDNLRVRGLLTEHQINMYHTYQSSRKDEIMDKIELSLEEMTPQEREGVKRLFFSYLKSTNN
jgi:hypothetical protein